MAISLTQISKLLHPGLVQLSKLPYPTLMELRERERAAKVFRDHVAKLDAMVAKGLTASGDPYDYARGRYVDERFNA